MADLSAFSQSYAEARTKFLEVAGPRVKNYLHSDVKGAAAEDLYLDVAVLGSPDASRIFAVGCGTHGIEGYPGSAALAHWLRSGGAKRIPKDTAVVFFHAHNPWGFAHKTRVTEENVDLNRNFIDFGRARPANPGYEEVHQIITPAHWDEPSVDAVFQRLAQFRKLLGEQAFSDALNRGEETPPPGGLYRGE